jgi:hypothetical protein
MTDRLKKKPATRRDAADAARLKLAGDPSHINPREDRLLRETMPEAHGRVVTRGLLAEAGRLGDDRVTLLIPEEAALLKARGGAGTRNPASGLLEYNNSGDSDTSESDNTSNAGENTGGMSGAPGSGVAGPEGPGTGRGDGPGPDGIGDAYSGPYGDYAGRSRSGVSYGRLQSRAYDPMAQPAVESLLAAPSFKAPGMSFTQYAPRDTWGRVFQEYFNPSIRTSKYGPTTGTNLGIMGAVTSFLSGQPMGMAMGWGAAMGRASSPATQAANAAAESARSAHNSGGNQGSHSLQDMDAKMAALGGAAPAGTASGAQTAELAGTVPGLTTAPGYTVNEAGQVVPTGGGRNTLTGLPTPVENLLADYIWRGRQGGGFGW